MRVNNNTPSVNFGYLRIIKSPDTIRLLREAPKEQLLEIQRAGEILGAVGDPNATKHYHLSIDTLNHFDHWKELRSYISCAKEAYFGAFKNNKYYGVYHDFRLDNKNRGKYSPEEAIYLRTRSHGFLGDIVKSGDEIDRGMDREDSRFATHADTTAKMLRILDDVSVNKFLGEDNPVEEVVIPKINRQMTADELLEKYGADA